MHKVRSRVRATAVIVFVAAGLKPTIVLTLGALSLALGRWEEFPDEARSLGFHAVTMALSVAVWIAARDRRTNQALLHTLGRAYEVVVCFIIAVNDYGEVLGDVAVEVPRLTWVVPTMIIFPLVLPMAPRKVLVTSVAAAGATPLALAMFQLGGRAVTTDNYIVAIMSPGLAVALAYFAARVVYELNADVVQARQLGSYQLVDEVGRGGMGEVWRAKHRMLARPAAIKLIHRDTLAVGAQAELTLKRFEREAQATALLRSPHTVEVYDFGIADDGAFYYVMELLEGFNADELVQKYGPVPAERAVHLLLQACDSLAEAHERGLIHRDIKPANIHVCQYGRKTDFVKVLDFGLVKSRLDAQGAAANLTADNVLGGTPAYMAPEQALAPDEVDGRADLYALGCVAYWLLTGCSVFDATAPMAMVNQHINEAPVPPSQRTEIRIPPELEAIILDCLRKEPGERPPNAEDLAARLAAVPLANAWTPERSAAWWKAHQPAEQGPVSLG